MAETYLTREGYEKLRTQLAELKERKQKLALEIEDCREQGDLRENAGYHAAKERQAETLRLIDEISEKLRGAKLIDEIKGPSDQVRIGAKVTLEDGNDKEKYTYILVGPDESNPVEGKISVHSPLAQGLLGAKAGQDVKLNLPVGAKVFKVVKVEYGA